MLIKSYLVYPVQGRRAELEVELQQVRGCEVVPSTNRDLLILITEAANKKAEDALFSHLSNLTNVQALTLVSAYSG